MIAIRMKTSWHNSTHISLQRVGSYSLSFHTISRLSQHTIHPNNNIHPNIHTFFIPSSVVDFEQLDSYAVQFDDSTRLHNDNMDYCPSVAKL